MSIRNTTNPVPSHWSYRTFLREPAHPLDDNRVSINTQINPENSSETYRRADLSFDRGEWQAWDHNEDVQSDGYLSSTRTTFYVNDLSEMNLRSQKKHDRLWKFQMGRGHTWEDDPDRKKIVENEATIKLCDSLLQLCETPRWARKIALSKVHNMSLNGFNKHYKGINGACFGFALLAMCDGPEEAKENLVAKRAATQLPLEGFNREFIDSLIDYVFRKYGDNK
ncbi:hypothetical protein [Natronorubrum sp. FCH18a]|uniref:hypothetical protein n=1 Tax=Natronorubrum sp. FCH18a TaxID=3447018 RepID=UPI003F5160D2